MLSIMFLFVRCTNPAFFGCERAGSPVNYVNPIVSARLRTVNSFTFKYGFIEVRAQNPTGDWLWPAIWMMPASNVYGQWPVSGEIDIMETRGNLNLTLNDVNIGVEQVGHTLHFGPTEALNSWPTTTFNVNTEPGEGFNNNFHNYQMEWNEGEALPKIPSNNSF
jgi:beta-glucanase (GH16 family)